MTTKENRTPSFQVGALFAAFLAAAALGLHAADKNDIQDRLKAWDQKLQEARPVLEELKAKAAKAEDPILVWHEAARVDNPFVKDEAISQMLIRLDPRSLPILEGLSKETAEMPPYRHDEGVLYYPAYAERIAKQLRAKIAFEKEMAKSEAGKRVQAAASALTSALKTGDDYTRDFALDWLLKQPVSEEVIDALLLRPLDWHVTDYFAAMDRRFMPFLYRRLEQTDDGDVARGLACLFLNKRHDVDSIPVLLTTVIKQFKVGDESAGTYIAMALGSFGDRALPTIDRIWGEKEDVFVRKWLAIVASDAGSPAGRALLEKWQASLKTELQTMQDANDTESAQFKTKRDLVRDIRLFIQNSKQKGE